MCENRGEELTIYGALLPPPGADEEEAVAAGQPVQRWKMQEVTYPIFCVSLPLPPPGLH